MIQNPCRDVTWVGILGSTIFFTR